MSDDTSEDASIDSLLREAGRIAPVSKEPDRVGERLGRYRIDEKLGEGGMGVVYAAEDLELGRRVALKVLPRASVADDDRRRRFLREARTAAAVSHPNLAALFDVGEADGTVFLAMELIRGASLRTKIAAAPKGLPVDEAVSIAFQIARGLGKAHAAGVVHRDLKPENVMMDVDGTAKVVDFGLAKLLAPEPASPNAADLSTQDGKILGTPSYMAPEQAKGLRVDATADVFSLGVVLYEMLTGARPFGGTTLVDVLVAIARDDPSPPSKRSSAVSRELDRVVLRCLSKEPGSRFDDGDAVAAALGAIRTTKKRSTLSKWALPAGLVLAGSAIAALGWPTAAHEAPRAEVQPVASPVSHADAVASTAPPSAIATAVSTADVLDAAAPSSAASATARAPVLRPPPAGQPSQATPAASVDPLARQK